MESSASSSRSSSSSGADSEDSEESCEKIKHKKNDKGSDEKKIVRVKQEEWVTAHTFDTLSSSTRSKAVKAAKIGKKMQAFEMGGFLSEYFGGELKSLCV